MHGIPMSRAGNHQGDVLVQTHIGPGILVIVDLNIPLMTSAGAHVVRGPAVYLAVELVEDFALRLEPRSDLLVGNRPALGSDDPYILGVAPSGALSAGP